MDDEVLKIILDKQYAKDDNPPQETWDPVLDPNPQPIPNEEVIPYEPKMSLPVLQHLSLQNLTVTQQDPEFLLGGINGVFAFMLNQKALKNIELNGTSLTCNTLNLWLPNWKALSDVVLNLKDCNLNLDDPNDRDAALFKYLLEANTFPSIKEFILH